jgi:carbon storage regulator CsrA
MLVLTRRRGESVRIDDIEVTVVAARRDHVRLGFTAPAHRKILRTELIEEKTKRDPSDQKDLKDKMSHDVPQVPEVI